MHAASPCIFAGLVAHGRAMQGSIQQVKAATLKAEPVWLLGERGTGRHMLAQCVHLAGNQHEEPFIRLRCASYQGMALQRELLGTARYPGLLQRAHGGTLYLEEVEYLSPWEHGLLADMLSEQLHDKNYAKGLPRLVLSSGVDLRMQADDWHWLQEICGRTVPQPIMLPSLHGRLEDVPALAERLLWRMMMTAAPEHAPHYFAPDVVRWLGEQTWPENMVELRQRLRVAVQHYMHVPNPHGMLEMVHFFPSRDADRPEKTPKHRRKFWQMLFARAPEMQMAER